MVRFREKLGEDGESVYDCAHRKKQPGDCSGRGKTSRRGKKGGILTTSDHVGTERGGKTRSD